MQTFTDKKPDLTRLQRTSLYAVRGNSYSIIVLSERFFRSYFSQVKSSTKLFLDEIAYVSNALLALSTNHHQSLLDSVC
ncbi:hypothetical protein SRHO_G00185630 [Serrasalmus rhombeus]